MYSGGAGIVYGFHGCDRSVAEKIINQQISFKRSENTYDWLGHGMYFWENSPSRAKEFAEDRRTNPEKAIHPIKDPTVIGAVIHLGKCLDLLDYNNLKLLREGFNILKDTVEKLPKNISSKKSSGELMLRHLDCAVIETLHKVLKDDGLCAFDSVKGFFWEGKELYPNAGFREKDHVQLCIRNPNCIKAFFYPRETDQKFYEL